MNFVNSLFKVGGNLLPWNYSYENNNVEFLKCKPPINEAREEGKDQQNAVDIRGEISLDTINFEGSDKNIGNLSIIARELSDNNNSGGIDLVIVMDVSGSMSSVANESIKILKYAVECLSSSDRLSIIVFDSSARHLFPLQPMLNSVKPDLKAIIDKCFTGGSTNLASALDLLIRVKNDGMMNNRPFKVIILSDGQPDSGCEGFHLVEKIYEGEIRPEVFSCTFGGSVRADTMTRLLLPENKHYYKHISNMEEFKSLIIELGLDKNTVIGTNLVVKFRGVKPLSDLANPLPREEGQQGENDYEIRINQIKTGDIFTTAFDYKTTFEISASYTDIQHNRINMQIKEVQGLDSFVKNHYLYKSITEMIKAVNNLENRDQKIERLNYLETLATQENLGDFLTDIKDLLQKTRLMYDNVGNNFESYNMYSQQVSSISSYATPVVKKAYKNYTK